MKSLALLAVIVSSLYANANSTTQVVVDEKAYINICDPRMLGCQNNIMVNGKPYHMLYKNQKIRKTIENIIGTYRFYHMHQSRPFKVTGVPGKVTGVFPNPRAEFDAFKIITVEGVILPK